MSWILADIKSLFPLSQTAVASVPQPGDEARSFKSDPSKDGDATSSLEYPLASRKPSVVVFVRHLGCPFCQETIQEQLIPLAKKHDDIDFFLISQADTETTRSYVSRLPVEDPSNIPFTILSSPAPHSLYSMWGISQLSAGSVFGPGVISRVMELAREKGIKNQETVGSRWLNSGAFAVSAEGKVLWSHVAARADDVSDLKSALKAIDGQK